MGIGAKDAKPPPGLVKAWRSKQWQALPRGPVLNDQDAGELHEMTTLLNVYEAYRELYTADNVVALGNANPDILEIVGWVRQLERDEMAREAKEAKERGE